MWCVNSNNGFLQHEGILGQKWGVRNGPPYPLGYSKHSSAEKSKNPKTRIDGDPNTGKKKSSSGLTDKQKTAIKIGAVVVGTALVAIGGYELYKHRNEIANLSIRGKQYGSENVDIKMIPKIPSDREIVSHAIKRNDELISEGSKNHCPNIFMQMECEERGLLAEAISRKEFGNEGRSIDEVLEGFSGASLHFDEIVRSPKQTDIDSPEKFKRYLVDKLHAPSESRGFLSITINQPDGTMDHDVQWKLHNNELTIRDGVHGEDAIRYLSMLSSSANAGLFRSDNLLLDEAAVDGNFVKFS